MGVTSLLERINNKGKVAASASSQPPRPTARKAPPKPVPSPASSRPVDPVVAALKEKRRLENKQKEDQLRAKKGLPPRQERRAAPQKQTRERERGEPSKRTPKSRVHTKQSSSAPPPPPPLRRPREKLSFDQLMKKAKLVDAKTLLVNYKPKSDSDPVSNKPARMKPLERYAAKEAAMMRPPPTRPPPSSRVRVAGKKPPSKKPPSLAIQKPVIRAPNKALQERLQQRKRQQYEEDSEDEDDDDGFVVDDDEGGYNDHGGDFDRDEIWALFNRGKKRTYAYDDYDLDDMEATGAEVLAEESRSRRSAMMEDQREAEDEFRRAEAKRKRLGR